MKYLKNRRGEGYIDICVMIISFISCLVIALNIFSFITLKVEMDTIAEELIESATYEGEFGDEFENRTETMKDVYYEFETEYGADEWFNTTLERVQLGDEMWVTISKETYVKGLGAFKIPVTVKVTRSGISEKYWK
jgi:hypothetical protein